MLELKIKKESLLLFVEIAVKDFFNSDLIKGVMLPHLFGRSKYKASGLVPLERKSMEPHTIILYVNK